MSSFEDFVKTAKGVAGDDVDQDWLKELWDGADGNANRAVNHLLDTPPEKFRRSVGGGAKTASSSRPEAPVVNVAAERPRSPSEKKKKKKKSSFPSFDMPVGFDIDTNIPAGMAGMEFPTSPTNSFGDPNTNTYVNFPGANDFPSAPQFPNASPSPNIGGASSSGGGQQTSFPAFPPSATFGPTGVNNAILQSGIPAAPAQTIEPFLVQERQRNLQAQLLQQQQILANVRNIMLLEHFKNRKKQREQDWWEEKVSALCTENSNPFSRGEKKKLEFYEELVKDIKSRKAREHVEQLEKDARKRRALQRRQDAATKALGELNVIGTSATSAASGSPVVAPRVNSSSYGSPVSPHITAQCLMQPPQINLTPNRGAEEVSSVLGDVKNLLQDMKSRNMNVQQTIESSPIARRLAPRTPDQKTDDIYRRTLLNDASERKNYDSPQIPGSKRSFPETNGIQGIQLVSIPTEKDGLESAARQMRLELGICEDDYNSSRGGPTHDTPQQGHTVSSSQQGTKTVDSTPQQSYQAQRNSNRGQSDGKGIRYDGRNMGMLPEKEEAPEQYFDDYVIRYDRYRSGEDLPPREFLIDLLTSREKLECLLSPPKQESKGRVPQTSAVLHPENAHGTPVGSYRSPLNSRGDLIKCSGDLIKADGSGNIPKFSEILGMIKNADEKQVSHNMNYELNRCRDNLEAGTQLKVGNLVQEVGELVREVRKSNDYSAALSGSLIDSAKAMKDVLSRPNPVEYSAPIVRQCGGSVLSARDNIVAPRDSASIVSGHNMKVSGNDAANVLRLGSDLPTMPIQAPNPVSADLSDADLNVLLRSELQKQQMEHLLLQNEIRSHIQNQQLIQALQNAAPQSALAAQNQPRMDVEMFPLANEYNIGENLAMQQLQNSVDRQFQNSVNQRFQQNNNNLGISASTIAPSQNAQSLYKPLLLDNSIYRTSTAANLMHGINGGADIVSDPTSGMFGTGGNPQGGLGNTFGMGNMNAYYNENAMPYLLDAGAIDSEATLGNALGWAGLIK